MHIYYSEGSDPMILDSLDGMNGLYDQVMSFLQSDQRMLRIDADDKGDSGPYDERLAAFEFRKSDGPIMLSLSSSGILSAVGSVENLLIYAQSFRFSNDEEGNHHHPEYVDRERYMMPGTMSLIVEVNSDLVEELKSSE